MVAAIFGLLDDTHHGRICEARLRSFAKRTGIGNVKFIESDCAYEMGDLNPCTYDLCVSSPEDELCQQFTASYCANNPQDGGPP